MASSAPADEPLINLTFGLEIEFTLAVRKDALLQQEAAEFAADILKTHGLTIRVMQLPHFDPTYDVGIIGVESH
jgi:hypothetical protein